MSAIGAALLVYLGYLLLRFPHLRRLAWRNMRKQRRSISLTIIGLAVSTALISMTFMINDTLSRVTVQSQERLFGPIAYDISSRNQPALSGSLFSLQSIQDLRGDIDGAALPIVSMPATYMTKNEQGKRSRISPHVHTIGVDAAEAVQFDPTLIEGINDWPKRDEVLLSSQAAAILQVDAGEELYVVDAANREHRLLVIGVVQEHGLTGYPGVFYINNPTSSPLYTNNAAAIVSLETARALTGIEGPLFTNLLLTSEPPPAWHGTPVRELFAMDREDMIQFFTVFIGMVSLSAIIIGIVLVTNIFRLFAEERRREIGILRAMGLGKSDVRRLLMTESLLYGIFSGIIGVLIGWLLAYLFLSQITSAFQDIAIPDLFTSLISSDPLVPLAGLSTGLLVIFVCVMFIAGKAAKQSIIHAIQPAPIMQPKKNHASAPQSWLLIMAVLILVSYVILLTVPEIRTEWITYTRVPLFMASITLSIALLLPIGVRLLPSIGTGFLHLCRNSPRASLVIRLAFRNMNTSPLQTGLIMLMFAVTSFFLCAMLLYTSTMTQTMHHYTSTAPAGGHELAAKDWRALQTDTIVRHMRAAEEYDQRLDSLQITAVQHLVWKEVWSTWGSFQHKVNGIDQHFAESNAIPLLSRDSRFASDREAWRELAQNDEVVILAEVIQVLTGTTYEVGDQFEITIGDRTVSKKVIAIAENSGYGAEFYVIWLKQSLLPELAKTAHELHSTVFIKQGDHTGNDVIDQVERLLTLQNIHLLMNIAIDNEREYYRDMAAFGILLQSFNIAALGIGLTALVVIMYRLILQRSRQVGMLRAIGIRPKSVLNSLLFECFFVGGFGIILGFAAGTAAGSVALSTIFKSTETELGIAFPYLGVLGYFCSALALSLVISYLPARHALKIQPTEAIRI